MTRQPDGRGGSYWVHGQYQAFLTEWGDPTDEYRPSVAELSSLRSWIDEISNTEASAAAFERLTPVGCADDSDSFATFAPGVAGAERRLRRLLASTRLERETAPLRAIQSTWTAAQRRDYWRTRMAADRTSKRRLGLCAESGCFRLGSLRSMASVYCLEHSPSRGDVVVESAPVAGRYVVNARGDKVWALKTPPKGAPGPVKVRRADVPRYRMELGELAWARSFTSPVGTKRTNRRRAARGWYLLAAADGNLDAVFALGRLAAEDADFSTAETWWIAATRAGDGVAAAGISALYLSAEAETMAHGIWWREEVDRLQRARYWAEIAKKLGHRTSADTIDQIERLVSQKKWAARRLGHSPGSP